MKNPLRALLTLALALTLLPAAPLAAHADTTPPLPAAPYTAQNPAPTYHTPIFTPVFTYEYDPNSYATHTFKAYILHNLPPNTIAKISGSTGVTFHGPNPQDPLSSAAEEAVSSETPLWRDISEYTPNHDIISSNFATEPGPITNPLYINAGSGFSLALSDLAHVSAYIRADIILQGGQEFHIEKTVPYTEMFFTGPNAALAYDPAHTAPHVPGNSNPPYLPDDPALGMVTAPPLTATPTPVADSFPATEEYTGDSGDDPLLAMTAVADLPPGPDRSKLPEKAPHAAPDPDRPLTHTFLPAASYTYENTAHPDSYHNFTVDLYHNVPPGIDITLRGTVTHTFDGIMILETPFDETVPAALNPIPLDYGAGFPGPLSDATRYTPVVAITATLSTGEVYSIDQHLNALTGTPVPLPPQYTFRPYATHHFDGDNHHFAVSLDHDVPPGTAITFDGMVIINRGGYHAPGLADGITEFTPAADYHNLGGRTVVSDGTPILLYTSKPLPGQPADRPLFTIELDALLTLDTGHAYKVRQTLGN